MRVEICLAVLVATATTAFGGTALAGTTRPLDRGRRIIRVDTTAPEVELHVYTLQGTGALHARVDVRDDHQLSEVVFSLEGAVVGARTGPPFWFDVTIRYLPSEVCALAKDLAGNGSVDCKVVTGPNPCFDNDDCAGVGFCKKPLGRCAGLGSCSPGVLCPLIPPGPSVCGCDGRTHIDSCHAEMAGVSLASFGECP
jgi:hypothetical protein